MAESIYNVTPKNIVDFMIIDRSPRAGAGGFDDPLDSPIIVLPSASEVAYVTNAETARITKVDCQGVETTAKRYKSAEDPVFRVTIPAKSPETVGLKLNRKIDPTDPDTFTTRLRKQAYTVPDGGLVAAATAGTLGFGITADIAGARGSYVNDQGMSRPLMYGPELGTPVNYADYTPATDIIQNNFFVVGVNGAMKFSRDLWRQDVAFEIPIPAGSITSAWRHGSTAYVNLDLVAISILVNGQLVEWRVPVSPDPAGEIPLREPQLELPFFAEGAPEVTYLGMLNLC